jgi:glycosyltransferase involved in cell wall biosynthesis
MMRIGVFDRACAGWTAGGELSRAETWSLLLAAHGFEDVRIAVITTRPKTFGLPPLVASESVDWVSPFMPSPPSLRERLSRRILGETPWWRDPLNRAWHLWAAANKLDVLLSFEPPDWWVPGATATCCSIPDFQHVGLPNYFTADERAFRDESCRRQGELTDLAVLHSAAVAADFRRFLPACSEKPRVFHFPSLLCFSPLDQKPDAAGLAARYGLDEGFFLVMNQFWVHKNHRVIIEALGQLKKTGTVPQVVMIGQPTDTRDPSGRHLSALLGRMAELGLDGRIKLLGFVDAKTRDDLIRCCCAILQPSLFEGWNTAIEDAKAVGRPVIASDLAVHREQIPGAFALLPPDDVAAWAAALARARSVLPPGPDRARETAAIGRAREAAKRDGTDLIAVCREAVEIARQRMATR